LLPPAGGISCYTTKWYPHPDTGGLSCCQRQFGLTGTTRGCHTTSHRAGHTSHRLHGTLGLLFALSAASHLQESRTEVFYWRSYSGVTIAHGLQTTNMITLCGERRIMLPLFCVVRRTICTISPQSLWFCCSFISHKAKLVLPTGFEPVLCANLAPMPEYKSGVLPLNYRSKFGGGLGNRTPNSAMQTQRVPVSTSPPI
jgi:hypothetical protein